MNRHVCTYIVSMHSILIIPFTQTTHKQAVLSALLLYRKPIPKYHRRQPSLIIIVVNHHQTSNLVRAEYKFVVLKTGKLLVSVGVTTPHCVIPLWFNASTVLSRTIGIVLLHSTCINNVYYVYE